MIVTATQLKINGIAGFFRFIFRIGKIKKQLALAEGMVFVKFNGARTLTGWDNAEAMKVFRNNSHHLDAMKNMRDIGKAKSITWETESEPDWNEAIERLDAVQFRF